MYHRVRRKMRRTVFCAIVILSYISEITAKTIDVRKNIESTTEIDDDFENNVIDFDEEYSVKLNKKYDPIKPWDDRDKNALRYTIIKKNDETKSIENNKLDFKSTNNEDEKLNVSPLKIQTTTTSNDYTAIPIELISTTENSLIKLLESTTEQDLTVIPLSTTKVPKLEIKQTITLPTSTQTTETTETSTISVIPIDTTTNKLKESTENSNTTTVIELTTATVIKSIQEITDNITREFNNTINENPTTTDINEIETTTIINDNSTAVVNATKTTKDSTTSDLTTRSTKESIKIELDSAEVDPNVPIFTELDADEEIEVPEDYYDSKDVIPTPAPKTDALSVIFGFAGSVVESVVETVAEKVVPKGIYDLFKRMQKQNEALEAERLRSREENGGLGQFGRGLLKTISTGLTKPLNQLMAGVRDIGSLDSDRGFISSLATGMTSVATAATSVVDVFKDRVQTIYPGTVWCGGGHAASARSSDLGLFFFTDTCCRQHDACKIYIKAGETKYGLTNTGLFTRSHCSCDAKFRDCLQKTNSLVSSQIGWTYFNVLGPQCFRKAHPIVRCVRRTRITGQKCEEYELDYTKPKMWQWFDNDTF